MQQQYVAAKYLTCIMCVCMYNVYMYISTSPARHHHHPTPPHAPPPKDGSTPIHVAASHGKTNAMKELMSAGCDINLADKVKQKTRLALALALRAFRARLPLAPLATLNLQYWFRLLLEP
jgi:hypothetical protein